MDAARAVLRPRRESCGRTAVAVEAEAVEAEAEGAAAEVAAAEVAAAESGGVGENRGDCCGGCCVAGGRGGEHT